MEEEKNSDPISWMCASKTCSDFHKWIMPYETLE